MSTNTKSIPLVKIFLPCINADFFKVPGRLALFSLIVCSYVYKIYAAIRTPKSWPFANNHNSLPPLNMTKIQQEFNF